MINLWYEAHEANDGRGLGGGLQVQQVEVRGEVVSRVLPGQVVEVRVLQELPAIPDTLTHMKHGHIHV